jgi:cytochrome P450
MTADTTPPRCPVEHTRSPEQFNPFTPHFNLDPYAAYRAARVEQPVFYSPVMNMWVVTRYDDLKTVMRDTATYTSGGAFSAGALANPVALEAMGGIHHPIYQYSLVNTDAPLHTRFRNSFQRAFTPRKMALLEPQISELVHALLEDLRANGRTEIIKGFCDQLPLLTICRLMGVPDADAQNVKRWSTDYIRAQIPGWDEAEQRRIGASILEYYAFMLDLVRYYARNPAENLLSTVIEARQGGEESPNGEQPLSDEEIAGLACNLVFAGHETTAALLGNTLHTLLTQRELWSYFGKHPERAGAAVDELVRHGGPAYGLYRRTARDAVLGGVTIPKDSTVFIAYFSANHDEEQFPDAERVNVERVNAANHFTLGHGIHYCIGAPLAKLELRVMLEALPKTFPSLRLEPGQTLKPVPSFLVRAFEEMVLVVD